MGRPSKFTDERSKRIISALRAGNYLETAARYGGIAYDTLNDWVKRGHTEKDGKYRQFSEAVENARAEAEVSAVATVRAASRDQWQAAAWWLERSQPGRWGRKDRVEHEGSETKPIRVTIEVVRG